MSALKTLINLFLKDLLKKSGSGKGITSLKNLPIIKVEAESQAKDFIAKALESGIDLNKIPENRIRYIFELSQQGKSKTLPEALARADIRTKGEVVDLTGKTIQPGETIVGGKGFKIEMSADDYGAFKEEWFSRIMTNTDEALNTFLKRGINQADERFLNLTRNQRKDFLDMVEYRLKHGNEKFMNDLTDAEGKFKLPEDLAYGGLAGMLGERTRYAKGRWGDPGMSPGTRSDYTPGQGHRERVGGPPGGGDPGMTYTARPSPIYKDPYPSLPEDIWPKIEKKIWEKKIDPLILAEKKKQRDLLAIKRLTSPWFDEGDEGPFRLENYEKFKTLPKDKLFPQQDLQGHKKPLEKIILNKFSTLITLKYPDDTITDEFGYIDKEKAKEVAKKAVIDGNLSIGDSLTLTRTLDSVGEGETGIKLDTKHFTASGDPEANEYTVGSKYNIGDLGLNFTGDIQNEHFTKKGLTFDYDDKTLTGGITKDYDNDYTFSELGLDKTFDLNDLAKLNIKGDISQRSDQDFTTSSLTPKLNIDYKNVSANIAKNIIEGGTPELGLGFSYPFEKTIQGDLILDNKGQIQFDNKGNVLREPNQTINTGGELYGSASNLLEEPQGTLGYGYKKGNWGANVEIDPFSGNKTAFLGYQKKFAGGGLAGMLGEPTYADGGRTGFKGKKFDPKRRTVLKGLGALAAIPFIGKYFKWAKPLAKSSKILTQVPIENAAGMPVWFPKLVNRVIKEGEDITQLPPNKGGAFAEREIVHSAKLGEGQGVRVTQNLDNQTISVEYHSVDNMGGIDDAVRLEYKAAEEIATKKGSVKTKPTFEAEEAWPHGTTDDYKDITMEGSNVVTKVDDLYSDTSALKQFGTNKTLSKKELEIAKQKRKRVNEINNDLGEQSQLLPEPPLPDDYPFASGGRVPLALGRGTEQAIAENKALEERLGWFRMLEKKSEDAAHGRHMTPFKGLTVDGPIQHADRPPEPEFQLGAYDPDKGINPFSKENVIEFDDGTFYYKDNGAYFKMDEDDEPYEVPGPSKGAKPIPKTVEVAEGGRVPLAGGGILKLLKLFKKKPETLKEFIDRRNFLKGMIGNTDNMKNKRVLQEILEETENVKGFEFPESGVGSDIHKEIEMILNKDVTKHATGGRVPLFAGSIAKLGKFTKSEILIKMLEKTLKGSKDSWSKTNLPNFIKELKAKPELANDPKVWNFFTNKLPKNQRLVVHSDDTVDFWRQSDFGPHNIKTTDKFIKKHPHLSRDEAVKIQNMEPEDQILEMKRLETIRNRTTNATGGRVSLSNGGLAGMLGE